VKAVNDDYIHRYINICEHYTGNKCSREEAIASITPYVDGREETFLDLLAELLLNLPSKVDDIDMLMKQYIGQYDQMFLDLQHRVRELETERNRLEQEDIAAETSTTSYINSTSTSAIAPYFVTTLGTSSLAAAAAAEAAKNNPPVVHGPVDIDLDNEVFGDDDDMPPPLMSGNKRRMNTRSNSNSALVLPDE
jgi:hypothetical protein